MAHCLCHMFRDVSRTVPRVRYRVMEPFTEDQIYKNSMAFVAQHLDVVDELRQGSYEKFKTPLEVGLSFSSGMIIDIASCM